MVKKGHPSPGFEPAPLEGSKKVMNFCLKLYHWATEASYNTNAEIQRFISNSINPYCDTVNTMKYSKIFENTAFFWILSLDISFDYFSKSVYMYIT